uniref:Myo-inositol oxygenase n=1 Tax=Megaviridae environmental sample TaxID=1737588 RepID=A0A5J6VKA5_9VIRU|nr:MAG: myo-inositol oxygenase [Megaviridae environmental sample]
MILNVSVIGCGRAGKMHLNTIKNSNKFKLHSVFDTNIKKAEEFSKIYKCSVDYTFKCILQKKFIDVVIITTPTNTHYDIVMESLKRNKHVFCEKPIGNNNVEINNCFNLAKKNNLKLLIGYQKRFDKNYLDVFKNQDEDPHFIFTTTRDFPKPTINYLKTSNGIVEDMLSHDIDIINYYMNFKKPNSVVAFCNTNDKELKDNNEIENISVLINYDNTIVNIMGSRKSIYGYDQRVEIYGDFGMNYLDNSTINTITKYNKDGIYNSKLKYSFPDRYKDAYTKELEHLYDIIVNDGECNIKQEHILLTKNICDAINESIKINKIIKIKDLRQYDLDTKQYRCYRDIYVNQTLESVKSLKKKYSNFDKGEYTLSDVLKMLDDFIDPSDPDVDVPNSIHAYQTAERIRRIHPTDLKLQITGLIHDLGKILFKFGEPSWNVVGDTFVVGCDFSDKIVYKELLKNNIDYFKYSKLGIYEQNCGLDKLHLSFGHDEYLYMVLKHNNTNLDQKYLDIIRYHSFYPWHTGNDYMYFMNDKDHDTLKNIRYFNSFDLYSKEDPIEITEEVKDYYARLLDDSFGNTLKW